MMLLTGLYMGVNAWTDWKRKEIDLRYTIFFCIAAGGIFLWKEQIPEWSGLLPGLCLWAISLGKKEKIGRGDGILVTALGWGLGIQRVMDILMKAFLLAGAVGILLLAMGRKKVEQIPFAPFLLCGFLISEVMR